MGDEQDSYQFEVTVHDVLSLQQLKTLEDGVVVAEVVEVELVVVVVVMVGGSGRGWRWWWQWRWRWW